MLGVSDAMGKFMRFKPQLVEAAAVDNCNSHLFNHAQRRARLLKAVGADPDEPAMPVASKDLAEAATALRSSYRNQLAAIIAQDAVADDPASIQPTISRELSDLADGARRRAGHRPPRNRGAASTCASPSSAWANSAHRN